MRRCAAFGIPQHSADYKRLQKRGYDMAKLRLVLEQLAKDEPHAEQYQDHPLRGNYAAHVIAMSSQIGC